MKETNKYAENTGLARIKHILTETPFFEEFTKEEIDSFASNLSLRFFPTQSVLFNEGDHGGYLFFVVDGLIEVRITPGAGSKKIIVGTFDRGSCLGEMSIIDDYPRSATIVVAEPAELLMLTRNRFDSICRETPAIGVKFLRGIAKNLSIRLRKTTGRFADLS